MTCDSHFIVYMLSCEACKQEYIGKSMYKLSSRIQKHVHDLLAMEEKAAMPFHFKSCPGMMKTGFKVVILEATATDREALRQAEIRWILRVQPSINRLMMTTFGQANPQRESPKPKPKIPVRVAPAIGPDEQEREALRNLLAQTEDKLDALVKGSKALVSQPDITVSQIKDGLKSLLQTL